MSKDLFFEQRESELNKDLQENSELIDSIINEQSQETNEFNSIVEKIISGESHLSYSALSQFLKSPKHFYNYKMNFEQTQAMIEGQMFHCAVLEPEKFKEKYYVLDDSAICEQLIDEGAKSPRSTKKYKEWLQSFRDSQTCEEISKELFDTLIKMSDYLRVNSATKELFRNAKETESPFLIEYSGFKLKGSIDLIGEDKQGEYIVDLKKVADASYNKVKWDIERKNYHLQGGLYSHATGIKRYYLIYIDKECNVTVVQLSTGTLESGIDKLEFVLDKFYECAETDSFFESYNFYQDFIVY